MNRTIVSKRDIPVITTRILRRKEVVALTGLSKSDLYRLQADGLFPHSIKIAGLRISGWDSQQVQEWIDNQLEPSRTVPIQ